VTNTSENKLPEEAQRAWEAYQEMGVSKNAYFGFLREIDEKYQEGGEPTIAENLQLEKLLKAHDEKVKAFNEAMQNIVDSEARELLVKKLSEDAAPIGRQ